MDRTLDLSIESLAYGGEAVAHAEDGRTVFVRQACPGDRVRARLDEEHPRFLRATVETVLEPSPERRTPPCPYFGTCGGCQWQHVSHTAQVEAKHRAVTDALTRLAGIEEPDVAAVVCAGQAYGYRNKLDLTVDRREHGGMRVGMLAAGTDRVVPIDACMLLPESCRSFPKSIGGALRYLSRGDQMDVSRIAIRAAANVRSVEVSLWTPPGPFPRAAAARTLASAAKFDSLTRVLYKGELKSRDVSKVEVLSGSGFWTERMGGHAFRVSSPSFFQVNTAVAEALVRQALDDLAPEPTDRVVDVFCGVGTFTLPLSELCDEVVAVESAGSAIRDLRRNLESAGLDADIMPGDAARVLPEVGHCDLALVDPPRSGLTAEVLAGLVACGPRRIVYVSCDPATLARDVKALDTAGYAFVRATPLDLFPQTFHVETVAVFDLRT